MLSAQLNGVEIDDFFRHSPENRRSKTIDSLDLSLGKSFSMQLSKSNNFLDENVKD